MYLITHLSLFAHLFINARFFNKWNASTEKVITSPKVKDTHKLLTEKLNTESLPLYQH